MSIKKILHGKKKLCEKNIKWVEKRTGAKPLVNTVKFKNELMCLGTILRIAEDKWSKNIQTEFIRY